MPGVLDQDWDLMAAADRHEAVELMTTIGWLLNYFGAVPGLTSQLDFLGGPTVPTLDMYSQMWDYTILSTVGEAVDRFQEGWSALRAALGDTTDEMLERDSKGISGSEETVPWEPCSRR